MPDSVIVRTALVTVGATLLDVRQIGANTWLVELDGHSIPIEGYDAAIAACDSFAAKVAPVLSAKAALAAEVSTVVAYTDQARLDFEKAKPADVLSGEVLAPDLMGPGR